MAYNTNNPLGSKDPKDLYDNATNFDLYSNGPDPMYPNRFGAFKLSIEGMNQQFNDAQTGRQTEFDQFLADSAFVFIGDYGAGLNFTSRSQYMIRDGIAYRLAPSATLPYTTTGNWALEAVNFTPISSDDILRQDLAEDTGSSLVGYIQSLTGSVGRDVLSRLREVVSIKDFGDAGGGDWTAIMNLAHATNKIIYYPIGTYNFTSLDPIAGGGIIGEGRDGTVLFCTTTDSSDAIVFNSPNFSPLFKDFTLKAANSSSTPVKTGGAGIKLAPVSGEISYARMSGVLIAFFPKCFETVSASYMRIESNEFLGYNSAGVILENVNQPDSGDTVIIGNLFNTPATTGNAVLQYSSGGAKIVGNKMLGGSTGYSLNYRGTTNSGVLVIVGNSIENMTDQCISMARQSGSSNFTNITITGNELAVGPTGIQTDASSFLSSMVIADNIINLLGSGSGWGVNLATVSGFYIGGNVIKGNGGTPVGIAIAASCSNGKIGKNNYATLSGTLNNLSTTTFVDKDRQTGTTTTATSGWSGYGVLFSGPATVVTFPTPFTVTPAAADVTLRPTSTNGATSYIVTGITAANFTYIPISSVTGIAAAFSWDVQGIV